MENITFLDGLWRHYDGMDDIEKSDLCDSGHGLLFLELLSQLNSFSCKVGAVPGGQHRAADQTAGVCGAAWLQEDQNCQDGQLRPAAGWPNTSIILYFIYCHFFVTSNKCIHS